MVVTAYGTDQALELKPIDPDAATQALRSPVRNAAYLQPPEGPGRNTERAFP